MRIVIQDDIPIGYIEIDRTIRLDAKDMLFYPQKILYNFEVCAWEDFEFDRVIIKLRGSIISMMQYRKYLTMNWPILLNSV